MNGQIIGTLINYWIFILGYVFVTRFILKIEETSVYIITITVITIAYWTLVYIKSRTKGKKGEK